MEITKKVNLGGLKKRWLLNTVGVVFILGLVCVLAVTATFATSYYSNMEAALNNRASTTTDFFADYVGQGYNEFYRSCVTYAKTFEDKDKIELQFINKNGVLVASSYGQWAGDSPSTPEIQKAMSTRCVEPYLGKDPQTGERVLAMSTPMIYSNGEVIGVLRFISSTHLLDLQIALIALVCFLVFAVVLAVVLLSSGY